MATNLYGTRFSQTTPDRVIIRSGGGFLALFGLPCLAAGIFLLLIFLHVLPKGFDAPKDSSRYVMMVVGLIFTTLGLVFITWRGWTIVDRSQGNVMTTWGLLFPRQWKTRSFSEFQAVRIDLQPGQTATNGRRSVDSYLAILHARQGLSEISVYNSTAYAKTREKAAFLAEFIGLPLVDTTTQHDTVIAPEHVGESYAERQCAKDAEDIGNLTSPKTMSSQVTNTAGTLQIAIPSSHQNLFTRVSVNPSGIVIEASAGGRTITTRISTADIVDIDYDRAQTTRATLDQSGMPSVFSGLLVNGGLLTSRGITVKAKSGLYTFAAGLPDDEVTYLYQLTRQALCLPVEVV